MMIVEAMVMAEMAVMVMVPVTIMMATHPGIGIEHARMDVHDSDLRRMRGPARAVSHRRRHR